MLHEMLQKFASVLLAVALAGVNAEAIHLSEKSDGPSIAALLIGGNAPVLKSGTPGYSGPRRVEADDAVWTGASCELAICERFWIAHAGQVRGDVRAQFAAANSMGRSP